ncbi:uncharacterized protein METZ01_LOCUS491455, partial [marine metagenome]
RRVGRSSRRMCASGAGGKQFTPPPPAYPCPFGTRSQTAAQPRIRLLFASTTACCGVSMRAGLVYMAAVHRDSIAGR